jgi:hypothetical protein
VQTLGDATVLQRQYHFHEAAHTRRPFHVSDVGLYRPDHQWMVRHASLAEHRSQGLHLDWIAQRCARTVTFHVAHVGRCNPRAPQRLLDHRLL